MFNCVGMGRFAQDPELVSVGNTKKASFSLAMDEFRKVNGERKKVTNFFDFEAWDTAAELICQYKVKGDLLLFKATPRKDTWEKDGQKKSKVYFRIDEFEFVSNGKYNQQNSGSEDKSTDTDTTKNQSNDEPF
jgi:single-strand DNA-binding protein